MKNKLIIGLLIGILFNLNSCAQKTENKNSKIMKIVYQDKIKNIYKEVKKFDYNPVYQIREIKYNCPMEYYVNDILVFYSSSSGKSAGEQNIDIPQYILKSGLQKIRVKIYPLLDDNKKFKDFVSRDASLKLRIVYGDYRDIKKWDDFKEVFKLELAKVELNLPFIELEGEFKAEVPYILDGWSKGVDLSKEDSKKLEQEVLSRMKEIANLYQNKDIEGLAKEQYFRTKEIDQSMYQNTKENSAEWASELQEALNESKEIELLEGKMKIMANGKLVTILVDSGKYKNQSIIRSKVEGFSDFYPQYFYRPHAGSRLEIIR